MSKRRKPEARTYVTTRAFMSPTFLQGQGNPFLDLEARVDDDELEEDEPEDGFGERFLSNQTCVA
jgi:hypothetical protein